ncbi:MAG TPA: hypothetical protein VFO40_23100 [Chthoniobacterales bacterium]|nr:hypothetical protein [Chthoniobacterales bacterium]
MVTKRYEETEAEEIKRGKRKRVYIWGTVYYQDAFEQDRYTNFFQSIMWVPSKEGGEIVLGNYEHQHNDAT